MRCLTLPACCPACRLQDEDDGYTGEPLSKWLANTKMGKNTDPKETRAVFVVRGWAWRPADANCLAGLGGLPMQTARLGLGACRCKLPGWAWGQGGCHNGARAVGTLQPPVMEGAQARMLRHMPAAGMYA